MKINSEKHRFSGRHPETGSIHNVLDLQGYTAPHTGKPYSESLLLGVSGGVAFGYFTFEYEGYLPHLVMLPRNTFEPFQTILERMGIPQDVQHTQKAEIGEKNLIKALETGQYPILWADSFSLPYNDLPLDGGMWIMGPIVAVGIEDGTVVIADRSSRPLRVSMEKLTEARGRVKKDKYRLITLGSPRPEKLASAVSNGIYQCIQLFTEKPPKGARKNFGFSAYEHLADMLTNSRNKHSWERYFEPGVRMYHALAGSVGQPGAYGWVQTWGAAPGMERGLYADFLDEASVILEKKSLEIPAGHFRESFSLWIKFADALLPGDVPLLGESKQLIQREHDLFTEEGDAALGEIRQVHTRLNELKEQSENDFPLSQKEAVDFRAHLRELLLKISETERKAVEGLQKAML